LKIKLYLSFVTWLGKRKKTVMIQNCSMNFLFPVLQDVLVVVGLPLMKLNELMALHNSRMKKSKAHK